MLKIIKTHRGAAMIETIIAFPILLVIGLGIVHVGLIFQAKSNLEYAALMAARYASTNASTDDIGIDSRGFNVEALEDIVWHRMRASRYRPDDPIDRNAVTLKILGPTEQMFTDFGTNASLDGLKGDCPDSDCIIPNDNLINRSNAVGASGASVQDANILRLQVTYGLDTKVPFMRPFFIQRISRDTNEPVTEITATAIVRMQVPARYYGASACYFDTSNGC